MTSIRFDLHTHTIFSPDSAITPDEFVRRCVAAGLDCVAVTEHDTIDGALYVRDIAPFRVVIGEEVRSREGEIIGLFLRETVPPGLSAEETVMRIREQGGVVAIPHPFDRFRDGLGEDAMLRILPEIDVIEVFNGRIRLARDNEHAERFARQYGITMAGGSDAHSASEVGRTYVVMPDFETPAEFLDSLCSATIVGRRAPRWVYAMSSFEKLRRRAGWGRTLPERPHTADTSR
ncbi:MAG TPA: PHP domain-containing protein [Dehalococcoidia bacterium]|nr:PHP domain-containing protein [Dehalococcoidia bacterium]